MGGQAVQEQRVGAGLGHQRVVDLERHHRRKLLLGMGLAHRDPGVGHHHAGAAGGGGGSGFTLDWDGGDDPAGLGFKRSCYMVGGKRARGPDQERKKGVPWTEEEHK
jgi:hypothetical protein